MWEGRRAVASHAALVSFAFAFDSQPSRFVDAASPAVRRFRSRKVTSVARALKLQFFALWARGSAIVLSAYKHLGKACLKVAARSLEVDFSLDLPFVKAPPWLEGRNPCAEQPLPPFCVLGVFRCLLCLFVVVVFL